MCTYKLTFNDTLIESVKHTFPSQTAFTTWMEQQMERMLKQISVSEEPQAKSLRKIKVSERIKALSSVPATLSDADYPYNNIPVITPMEFLTKMGVE